MRRRRRKVVPQLVSVVCALALTLAAGGLLSVQLGESPPGAAGTTVWAQEGLMLPESVPDAAAGLDIFNARCVECHGTLGRGDGERAGQLEGPPPSFADPEYMRLVTPAEAYETVTNGRLEKLMPPWKDALTDQERWNVVYGAWSFYYHPLRLARSRVGWEADCAGCHDDDGPDAPAPFWESPEMVQRSQESLFAAARAAAEQHAPAETPDDALWSALDYARARSFGALESEALTVDGVLSGRVANGTGDAAGVDGARLLVFPFSRDLPGDRITATVTASGMFTTSGLVAGPGVAYGLVAMYADVDYFYPDMIALTAEQPAVSDVVVSVFEPDPDVVVSARTAHMVTSPDPQLGVVQVSEVWVVRNDTDRTLVPGASGDTLRFELVPGAQSVGLRDPRMRASASLETNVLVDREPVPPGERQVSITYAVPYEGSELVLSRSLTMPTDEFRLMVTALGAVVESDVLVAEESAMMGDTSVVSAAGRDLPAGTRIQATIRGLPPAQAGAARSVSPLPVASPDQRWLAGGALAISLIGMALAVVYPALAAGAAAQSRRERVAVARERSLVELAALEDRRASGALSEQNYARLRAALMDRVLALSRARDADGGAS